MDFVQRKSTSARALSANMVKEITNMINTFMNDNSHVLESSNAAIEDIKSLCIEYNVSGLIHIIEEYPFLLRHKEFFITLFKR